MTEPEVPVDPEWPDWPGFDPWYIRVLAREYREHVYSLRAEPHADALAETWLRQRLYYELSLPREFIEFEFHRVVDAAFELPP